MRFFSQTMVLITAATLFILVNSQNSHATAQIEDTVIFKGNEYLLIGKTDGNLATPKRFGMSAIGIHTACYRGYYATYELIDEGLFLRKFTLREKDENYLPISGVMPVIEPEELSATYSDLNVAIPFSGKIRLAKDFIQDLYIHMGFQKPTAFKTVLDITLVNGKVVTIKDRSKEVEQKRGAFKKAYDSNKKSVDDAFRFDMKLE